MGDKVRVNIQNQSAYSIFNGRIGLVKYVFLYPDREWYRVELIGGNYSWLVFLDSELTKVCGK